MTAALDPASALDLAALERFAESGVFVWPAAIPESECEALTAALSALIARVAAEHLSGRRPAPAFWQQLAASAHATEVFVDERDGPVTALPVAEWESRAMRIGHGLHLAEPPFAVFCHRPEIRAPLRQLAHVAVLLSGGAAPEAAARAAFAEAGPAHVVQSAVIYKQPMSDVVQFGFHRDAAYLPAEPESLLLAFVALDAMTPENGCLTVIPGSHREPLGLRYRLDAGGFATVGKEPRPAIDRSLPLPMPRGSIAFVHGRTLHASAPNRSAGPRRALIVHALSARSQLFPDAWVQPPPGGFPVI